MLAKVTAIIKEQDYLTNISTGDKHILADEPASLGGGDKGFTPYDLLASSLASCSVITLRMYSKQKQWEVGHISAEVILQTDPQSNKVTFLRQIHFENATLEDKQYDRLLNVAQKCPVHKLLSGQIEIITSISK